MIGVIANPADHVVVSEFFEMFKTAWEFYRSDRRYEVLVCATNGDFDANAAQLVLLYSGHELSSDSVEKVEIISGRRNRMLSYKESRLPIYGDSVTFRIKGESVLVEEESQQAAAHQRVSMGSVVVRIGYSLFDEVRTLLTVGQSVAHAGIPTLDLHIALLRDLIVSGGVSLVEIPPVPDGYRFIACLTHDVDHPSIRQHKWDHTMFGFLYRAVLGSIFGVIRGRTSFRSLLTNWAAALKLPFVHLGIAKDFWYDFDSYTQLEDGLHSSFFVIPFKDSPGHSAQGPAPSHRGARYAASEIGEKVRKLISAGCEVGLHGIDAWLDSSSGRNELKEIRRITGRQDVGVRMHWLYFDEKSPATLERAGADYDSTVGYNQTVGFRAGTTQVYKPLEATRLLELPLHIMDTAMFFPNHLGLSTKEASRKVEGIIDHAVLYGGVVTVNWHDRSIAPERLWGDFYLQLIDELKNKGAWFATAAETVSWFRKRRSVTFDAVSSEVDVLVETAVHIGDALPELSLRVHRRGAAPRDTARGQPCDVGPRSPSSGREMTNTRSTLLSHTL
jgi:peptidoglycan/xylan/chitin deacetylase (PgdA/CDA1 family)